MERVIIMEKASRGAGKESYGVYAHSDEEDPGKKVGITATLKGAIRMAQSYGKGTDQPILFKLAN